MKVIVDHARCQGHALCMLKAPQVYQLNDDGYNSMPPTEVPPELEEQARLGAINCPEGAIRLDKRAAD
ncbi:ferredoxin [Sphingomonas histidinilytica]|uniref:Ferredoxin n=1 Tax=Rhizorhabdus histidinilytica TaxID=439228 RepID=A0A1T5GB79_9SPHN|nr:ferredoxin [Rhizorhabdus histidinilytica]MBO9379833.1 ferredoxin [Rhizorhabdus histidinilytica]QEH77089.1 ferredoxin [Sphingomonas sp. C8-2]SKC05700.1 ferredoxin [Rhizorhabdus histidinilytica]